MEKSSAGIEAASTASATQSRMSSLADLENYFICSPLRKRISDDLMKDEIYDATILDLGCGPCADFACRYADGNRCVALDIDVREIARFKNHPKRKQKEVEAIITDSHHLPFRGDAFDRIYASFALLYLDANELKRVGKEAIVSSHLCNSDVLCRLAGDLGLEKEKIERKDYSTAFDKDIGVFYARLNLR